MSSTARPCTRARRRLAAAAVLAAGLASCSSSGNPGCAEVSAKICDRLVECKSLSSVFTSQDECEQSFRGYFEVAGSDDAGCRTTWAEVTDFSCDEFLAYFKI